MKLIFRAITFTFHLPYSSPSIDISHYILTHFEIFLLMDRLDCFPTNILQALRCLILLKRGFPIHQKSLEFYSPCPGYEDKIIPEKFHPHHQVYKYFI